jgi:hypothetical protein
MWFLATFGIGRINGGGGTPAGRAGAADGGRRLMTGSLLPSPRALPDGIGPVRRAICAGAAEDR